MKVLIVEDEGIAADRLIQVLQKLEPTIEVVDHLDSVASVVDWIGRHSAPDLAFFDIQLADGLSFEIFEQASIDWPIIFTTAYDQYAIEAFKVNSVDYLLKPIDEADLKRALDKFKKQQSSAPIDTQSILRMLKQEARTYKQRFVIKVGEHLKSVLTAEVEVFFSQDKATYLLTATQKKHVLDFTLDQIEQMIDPQAFFRINRKYLIRLDSIKDIISYSNSRLKMVLHHFDADDLIVSRERVAQFKTWLDR